MEVDDVYTSGIFITHHFKFIHSIDNDSYSEECIHFDSVLLTIWCLAPIEAELNDTKIDEGELSLETCIKHVQGLYIFTVYAL